MIITTLKTTYVIKPLQTAMGILINLFELAQFRVVMHSEIRQKWAALTL